jgi:CHASE3 domain sensor protein
LPEDKRKFIYEKGAKEFETQIKAKIAELETSNTDELNFDGDLTILENVVSLKELNETVGQAKNHFKTEAQKIVGTNLDSNI